MERDDLIEYSLHAHHSEEKGKEIRKKIWMVTLLLTIITVVEVFTGAFIIIPSRSKNIALLIIFLPIPIWFDEF